MGTNYQSLFDLPQTIFTLLLYVRTVFFSSSLLLQDKKKQNNNNRLGFAYKLKRFTPPPSHFSASELKAWQARSRQMRRGQTLGANCVQ